MHKYIHTDTDTHTDTHIHTILWSYTHIDKHKDMVQTCMHPYIHKRSAIYMHISYMHSQISMSFRYIQNAASPKRTSANTPI